MAEEKKKKKKVWFWVVIIIIILTILYVNENYREKWEKENCDLTFNKYTYNDGCSSACSMKCSDEGFPSLSSSYFEPYLSAEEMNNSSLYKRCECNCGGCRE